MRWTPDDLLAAADHPPVDGLSAWRDRLGALDAKDPHTMAVLGGRAAGSVGWAFAFGYQAALRALWPEVVAGKVGVEQVKLAII